MARGRDQSPVLVPAPLKRRSVTVQSAAARLRTLPGAAPGDATYAQYLTLIRNPSAVESTDLDYKGEQYGKGTEQAGELAKDVAALATLAAAPSSSACTRTVPPPSRSMPIPSR